MYLNTDIHTHVSERNPLKQVYSVYTQSDSTTGASPIV